LTDDATKPDAIAGSAAAIVGMMRSIGRSSEDLYGVQIGGRLEDMGSFEKFGGSPTNIACGAARLGLTSAVITRVGDEHIGRFVVEQTLGAVAFRAIHPGQP
jgi:sugar/nucleoside kinase (ribokinase family)